MSETTGVSGSSKSVLLPFSSSILSSTVPPSGIVPLTSSESFIVVSLESDISVFVLPLTTLLSPLVIVVLLESPTILSLPPRLVPVELSTLLLLPLITVFVESFT